MIFKVIGVLVVATIIAAGVNWLLNNVRIGTKSDESQGDEN